MEFVDHCEITQVHQGAVDQVRQVLPPDEVLSDLADLFKIFGDSTRIKILYALLRSELCVCDIADLLGLTQSAISPSCGSCGAASWSNSAGMARPSIIPWPTSTSAASSARGWNTWKSERWLSFIADHVCLCPGRRGGPPGGGGGDRRASLLRLSGGGGASLQPCSVPSSCIPVDSVVMRP